MQNNQLRSTALFPGAIPLTTFDPQGRVIEQIISPPEDLDPRLQMDPILKRHMADLFTRINNAKVNILNYILRTIHGLSAEEGFPRILHVRYDERGPDYEEYWLDGQVVAGPGDGQHVEGNFLAFFQMHYGGAFPTPGQANDFTSQMQVSFEYRTVTGEVLTEEQLKAIPPYPNR